MHPTSLHPDYIFYNGRIFNPVSQYLNLQTALAIHAEKIFAVGNDSHILSLASPETRKFDCRGNWILPAFTDAHTHLCLYAARKLQVDLSGCASLNEALAVISEKVAVTPEGSWIRGGGWDKNSWGMENFPDKKYLDEISSRHFIALDSKDWHTLWVNSAVLQLCHISAATVHPGGGKIVKNDRNGEPTGILLENARWIVYDKIPPVAVKQLSNVLIHSFPEFHRLGITAVHSMETPDDYCVYQKLRDEGKLGLRISGYLPEKFLKEAKNLKSNPAYMNPFLKICGIKIFADGTLGSQTADMLDNFTGTNQRGIAVHSEEELHHIVEESVKTGLSCAVHAIGDAANRKVLDVFQEFDEQSRAAGLRHRIEHVQLLHPQDIPRFQQLGVFASMQPIHLAADIPVIKKYWGERGKYAFAFRSLLDNGARLIFGSDTPIETFDPWKAIYMAIERKIGANPAREAFHPQQGITADEAVRAYTQMPALAAGEENHLGTLEAGKLADFIVVDRDIFGEPPEVLLQTSVLLTIQNGRIVHQAEDFN